MLLGSDETSWKAHSLNVAAAHMCINSEETEFTKNKLEYGTGVRTKSQHHSTKTITPKK